MPLNVSYMGTKRKIAHRVARIVAEQPSGPLLDVFAGMCAVSTAVGQSRQVWCNDIQTFASSVATAFFTSPPLPISSERVATLALQPFRDNAAQLRARFADDLFREERALASGSVSRIRSLEHCMPNVAHDGELELERALLAERPSATPYRLVSITYSGGYFGLAQSIEIDSIRFAIDHLLSDRSINEVGHRWLCLALCQAASKVATTTGHFAQHMRTNDRNCARYVTQRQRRVWREWLRAVFENHPIGHDLLARPKTESSGGMRVRSSMTSGNPDIVPPSSMPIRPTRATSTLATTISTKPCCITTTTASHGSGRYRPDRFRSPFSMKTRVRAAIDELIAACAELGSTLVLSYPERGVLPQSHRSHPRPHDPALRQTAGCPLRLGPRTLPSAPPRADRTTPSRNESTWHTEHDDKAIHRQIQESRPTAHRAQSRKPQAHLPPRRDGQPHVLHRSAWASRFPLPSTRTAMSTA